MNASALPLAPDRRELTTWLTEAERRLLHLRNDPARFVRECITWKQGEGPTPYQDEVLRELPVRRRVSVRGPHGLGKTSLASWIILWFALTRDGRAGRDWKVVTTASVWRQLERYLWPEVHKWARRLKWDMLHRGPFREGQELLDLSLSLSTGEAFAVASDKADLIEGAHADDLLYVFDESKSIPTDTFDAAEGALSSGDCYALTISTPGEPQGRFYDIQSRRPGTEDWWVRAVTKDECIEAGRMSEDWAEQRGLQWGEQSAVYLNRVEGQFAASDESGIIPLVWIEAANERYEALKQSGEWDVFICVGVDVAREGRDKTVLALRFGAAIRELKRFARQDTMATTGHVLGVLNAHGGRAVVDVIGIGAGVVDRLGEQRRDDRATWKVEGFNAGEGTDWADISGELHFVNTRSAAWWNLREMLDPANSQNLALPPDDLLTGDLTAPHWRMSSGGKIQVESKDDIRKRLGRSTDDGDAVVQAYWQDGPRKAKPGQFPTPKNLMTTPSRLGNMGRLSGGGVRSRIDTQ